MLDRYLAELPFSDKRCLKRELQQGFVGGEIDLNAMTFVYDEDSGIVTVHDLIRGEGVDGTQLLLPDFVGLVNTVLAEVPVYETKAEEAEALRKYLLELPEEDRQHLQRRLPELRQGDDIIIGPLTFADDLESDTVRIDVSTGRHYYDTRDELFLPWAAFAGAVTAELEKEP